MPVSQPAESQKHRDYYEAIIQIRPNELEVIKYVKNQFAKSKTAWIPKVKASKTGMDIFSSNWRFALAVGKKLKRVYGGTIKTSRSLFSQDKMSSKLTYRVTVCWRKEEENDQKGGRRGRKAF